MAAEIKVLMQIRENFLTASGGDTIQLMKTKEYLEKRGVHVDHSIELEPDLSGYDIVHLFNITRIQETYIHMKNAKKQGKPIALSTIYWPFDEINQDGFEGPQRMAYRIFRGDNLERVKALYKYIFCNQRNKGCKALILGSHRRMQRETLEKADIWLPNGLGEIKQIEKVLHVYGKEYIVVPNGVDLKYVSNDPEDRDGKDNKDRDCGDGKYGIYRDAIVCVARISERKNQIHLIEALNGTDYKIVFVGKESSGEMKYYSRFLDAIRDKPNITYIQSIPHEEIYHLYRQCKVSVLPSWFETPGLASLEAGAMGCNLVVTDKGTTREYFDKYAYYCNVGDIQSIRDAVDRAYHDPCPLELRERILSFYTWEEAARKTEQGYLKIMGQVDR